MLSITKLIMAIRNKPEEYHHSHTYDKEMYNFMKLYTLADPLPAGPVLHTTSQGPVEVKTYATAVSYDKAGQRVILQRQADGCYPHVNQNLMGGIILTWNDSKRNRDEICYAYVAHNAGHVADLKWSEQSADIPQHVGYRTYVKHYAWFFVFPQEQAVWCCDS